MLAYALARIKDWEDRRRNCALSTWKTLSVLGTPGEAQFVDRAVFLVWRFIIIGGEDPLLIERIY